LGKPLTRIAESIDAPEVTLKWCDVAVASEELRLARNLWLWSAL